MIFRVVEFSQGCLEILKDKDESLDNLISQAHVKNAEKYLKTSPLKLKFTPDWDPAGDEFSRAATAFKEGSVFVVMVR